MAGARGSRARRCLGTSGGAAVAAFLFAVSGARATSTPPEAVRLPALRPPAQAGAPVRTGRFLVASRHLKDPRFQESVILLVEHGPSGSMGLAINRPSHATVSTILPDIEALRDRGDVAYIGGPVGLREMVFLFRSDHPPAGATHVIDDIYVDSRLDRLAELAARAAPFRVFAGYAGWAVGQLEVEILRGDWHVMRADASMVFAPSAGEVWPALIERAVQRAAAVPVRRVWPVGFSVAMYGERVSAGADLDEGRVAVLARGRHAVGLR